MIGYKVVSKITKHSYKPATRQALQKIRYKIGQTTEQNNCGAFCVFDNLQAAVDFLISNDISNATILEVEYEPARSGITQDEIFYLTGSYTGFDETEFFVWKWAKVGRNFTIETRRTFPEGTAFASSVTPVQEV